MPPRTRKTPAVPAPPKPPIPRRSRAKKPAEPPRPPTVAEATESAIAAAKHLTAEDDGALATLRYLARKIDTEDEVRAAYLRYQLDEGVDRDKLRTMQLDNVSVPTYLKFCESLGLTPAGRSRLAEKPKESGSASKVSQLRSQHLRPA